MGFPRQEYWGEWGLPFPVQGNFPTQGSNPCLLHCFTAKTTREALYVLDHILFIHSSVHGHLGCFYLLVIVSNAAMSISVQLSIWVPFFSSFVWNCWVIWWFLFFQALLDSSVVKYPPTMQETRHGFNTWVRKVPWKRKWQSTAVFLPGNNPMDRGALWATVHEVAKSWTGLGTWWLYA